MSDAITVHVYSGWTVTRIGSLPLNFGPMRADELPESEAAARKYVAETPAAALPLTVERTETTVRCGMDTRAFCGHCDGGWPARPLADGELIGKRVVDSEVIADPADVAC